MLRSSVTSLAKRVMRGVPKAAFAAASTPAAVAAGATSGPSRIMKQESPPVRPAAPPTLQGAPPKTVPPSPSTQPLQTQQPPRQPASAAGSGGAVARRKVLKKILKKKKASVTATASAPPATTAEGAASPSPLEPTPQTAPPAANDLPVQAEAPEPEGEKPLEAEAPEPHATPAAATAAGAAAPAKKTAMVKGFRISEVTSACDVSDAIFARRLPSGGCQFFAWPGTPLSVASRAIVSMPDTIRTVHAVFGRPNTPIDLVVDVDCAVPPEHWSMAKIGPYQRKVVADVAAVIKDEIEKIGEKIATQVVLQSPNLKKASFHVHTKLKDAAFADFSSLHGFLARFHERIPSVDLQIYRPNGMLRMYSCMKENHTSAMAVFNDPEWNIGFPNGEVPEAAAALHSVCVREAKTFSRLLRFEPPRVSSYMMPPAADTLADEGEEGQPAKPIPVLLPRTEQEAIDNASSWLRSATEAEVGEWRTWISLGLCAFRVAHYFKDSTKLKRSSMDEMLSAWVEASRRCPLKYKSGECETRWATFDISKLSSPDNWWGAYQRLGRLQVPAQQSIQREKMLAKSRERRWNTAEAPKAAMRKQQTR